MSEIEQGIRPEVKEEVPVPAELTREEKIETRVKELTEANSRRELEDMLRGLGVEPTKEAYPDKESLAKAIAEKEFPTEEPA